MKSLSLLFVIITVVFVPIFAQDTIRPSLLLSQKYHRTPIAITNNKAFVHTDFGIGVCDNVSNLPEVLYTGRANQYIVVSEDGKYTLAHSNYTESYDPDSASMITVWDVNSKVHLHTMWRERGSEGNFYISADNKFIIEIKGNLLNVYDLVTGTFLKEVKIGNHEYRGFSPFGKYLFTIDSGSLKLWNTETWLEHGSIDSKSLINRIEFSNANKRMVVSDYMTRLVNVYDVESMKIIASYDAGEAGVMFATLSNNGKRAAIVDAKSKLLVVWDVERDTVLRSYALGNKYHEYRNIYFLSDESTTIVLDQKMDYDRNVLYIWDYATYKYGRYFENDYRVYPKNSTNGELLTFAWGSYIYFLKDNKFGVTIDSLPYWSAAQLMFDNDNDYVVSAANNVIQKSRISDRKNVSTKELVTATRGVNSGRYFVCGNILDQYTVEVWDLYSGNKLYSIKIYGENFSIDKISENGTKLVVEYLHFNIRYYDVYDMLSGEKITTFTGSTFGSDYIDDVDFSPDGEKLYVVSRDYNFQTALHIITFQPIVDISLIYRGDGMYSSELPNSNVRSAVFDKENKSVTYVANDKIRKFDLLNQKEKLILTPENRREGYARIKYSNQFVFIAVFSNDTNVYIRDAETGKELWVLPHHSTVLNVCFSKNDEQIITACVDGNAYIWDIEKAKILKVLLSPRDSLTSVVFNNDETKVLGYNWFDHNFLWEIGNVSETKTDDNQNVTCHYLVFPNPTSSVINIEFQQETSSEMQYSILNVYGQVVKRDIIPQSTLHFSAPMYSMPSGTYIFCVEINGNKETIPFTIIQ